MRGQEWINFLTEGSVLMIDLIQYFNWWTGVVWITCGVFLWRFYQLFGLSFWWHPFTLEDSLVCKWCKAKFLWICSDEDTNLSISWMAWRWVNVQQMFIFGCSIPLKWIVHLKCHYFSPSHHSESFLEDNGTIFTLFILFSQSFWPSRSLSSLYLAHTCSSSCNFCC